jgi:hypothetical protein
VGDAGARQHKVRRTAARQGSDAWDHQKQKGVLESLRRRSVAKHGSGRPRTTWRGQGVASARSGKAAVEREGHVDGHRAALRRQRRRTWPEQRRRHAVEKTEEREREVDEGGPKCNIIEM